MDSLNYDDIDEDQPALHRRDDDEMELAGEQEEAASSSNKRDAGVHLYPFPAQLAVESGDNRGSVPVPTSSEVPRLPSDIAAKQWDEVGEWSPPEVPTPIGGGQDVRLTALHLTGKPISKLSTSRLFAYVSHFVAAGAQPLGLEWINDTSVNVVFQEAASARMALEYLCPPEASAPASAPQEMSDVAASYVPPALVTASQVEEAYQTQQRYKAKDSMGSFEQWPEEVLQSLLSPRKAHRFPVKLYNAAERDLAKRVEEARSKLASLSNGESDLPSDAPEIYRELEQQDRLEFLNAPETQELRKLQAVIWIRFTLESVDVKGKRAAAQSQWYRDHGRGAGKDVVEKILDVGDEGQRPELLNLASSSGRGGGNSQPLLRMGNVIANGGEEGGQRGRGGRRAAMDDLDDDLDAMRAAREQPAEDDQGRDRSASPGMDRRRRRNRLDLGGGASSSSSSSGMYGWGDEEAPSRSLRRGGGGMTSSVADLDEEMDDYSRHRRNVRGGQEDATTAPSQPRGRGRKKAPPSQPAARSSSGMFGWSDDTASSDSAAGPSIDEFGRSRALYQSLMSGNRKDKASSLAQRMGPASSGVTLEERMTGKNRLADRFAS